MKSKDCGIYACILRAKIKDKVGRLYGRYIRGKVPAPAIVGEIIFVYDLTDLAVACECGSARKRVKSDSRKDNSP